MARGFLFRAFFLFYGYNSNECPVIFMMGFFILVRPTKWSQPTPKKYFEKYFFISKPQRTFDLSTTNQNKKINQNGKFQSHHHKE